MSGEWRCVAFVLTVSACNGSIRRLGDAALDSSHADAAPAEASADAHSEDSFACGLGSLRCRLDQYCTLACDSPPGGYGTDSPDASCAPRYAGNCLDAGPLCAFQWLDGGAQSGGFCFEAEPDGTCVDASPVPCMPYVGERTYICACAGGGA
jgi:hypothetical protein